MIRYDFIIETVSDMQTEKKDKTPEEKRSLIKTLWPPIGKLPRPWLGFFLLSNCFSRGFGVRTTQARISFLQTVFQMSQGHSSLPFTSGERPCVETWKLARRGRFLNLSCEETGVFHKWGYPKMDGL